ncbi:nascent polypeptide-associated complex subunit alpha, muscle-specific form-like [Rousettus aegyptiacus]|uniref:nascent polypeptide-associated complex subunit alpha, muscle-specific form-like n=1 Tax=Rousettus aegyptiacus TaxID=9407 RepID=UPI00168D38E5|nr:nascent polypeptide-associated complex subunit alpha, muscle-specific form-like [Rousettus aegyptiacus]
MVPTQLPRGSPHFRCSALKYRNSPTLPDVTSPPPPPRPPHPRPAGRPAVARSGGGARAAPPGRQGRPAPLFPGPAKGGGAGTGGRHGNRKARRGLAGPARLAASVPPLRSRRRPLSPRPRAAPSPPARRGAPHPLYDANVLRASAATHPTQAPKPGAEKILHPRLRKSPALPPPFKVRPGEEDTVCPHLIKKELCRGSLHWGPEHPFSVITVSTFPAASASRQREEQGCASGCWSAGGTVVPP